VANRDDGRLQTGQRDSESKIMTAIDRTCGTRKETVSYPAAIEAEKAAGTAPSEYLEPGKKAPEARDYLYVLLMILIGSTTAPAAKYVVYELPIAFVPIIRFVLAGLCLLPVVWAGGGLPRLIRQDGWRLLLAAALCVPINQAFFLGATRLGPTSHVSLFYATCPLVVLMLVWASRMEKPDLVRLWGVLTSVAGIVIIGVGHFWEGGGGEHVQSVVMADLLLVGAVISWGGYIAVSKPLIERHGALPVLAGTFLAGCLMAAPVAFFAWPGLNAIKQVSPTAWMALAFLGLFVTPFGWAYQNLALRRFDASQVATFSNAAPVLTVIWGMWLFGEVVTPTLVVGGLLTLAGIYWICRPRPAAKPAAPRLESAVRNGRSYSERLPAVAVLALSEETIGR
jgi:drug/metabolite transporter (DMT)-like permease